jgi:hypothetical protein
MYRTSARDASCEKLEDECEGHPRTIELLLLLFSINTWSVRFVSTIRKLHWTRKIRLGAVTCGHVKPLKYAIRKDIINININNP